MYFKLHSWLQQAGMEINTVFHRFYETQHISSRPTYEHIETFELNHEIDNNFNQMVFVTRDGIIVFAKSLAHNIQSLACKEGFVNGRNSPNPPRNQHITIAHWSI
jgi:hypothetical protein